MSTSVIGTLLLANPDMYNCIGRNAIACGNGSSRLRCEELLGDNLGDAGGFVDCFGFFEGGQVATVGIVGKDLSLLDQQIHAANDT